MGERCTPWYICPPCMPGSVYHPVHTVRTQPAHGHHCGVRHPMCSYERPINEERLLPLETGLSHPENKAQTQGKPLPFGQETRYRKHSCTRMPGMSVPLQECSQTPLGVRSRLFSPLKTRSDLPVLRRGWAFNVQKVRNWTIRASNPS